MTTKQKQLAVLVCLMAITATNVLAQGDGRQAINTASSEILGYFDSIGDLVLAIAGLVGFVGVIRVFQKWNGGDKDINKDIMAWGGSCVFVIIAGIFLKAVFGI